MLAPLSRAVNTTDINELRILVYFKMHKILAAVHHYCRGEWSAKKICKHCIPGCVWLTRWIALQTNMSRVAQRNCQGLQLHSPKKPEGTMQG